MDGDKMALMRELVDTLNEAADAYYNGRAEKMTDYEWDAMFDRLKALEEETGEVLPDSPTNRVSEDDITGQKEPHEFPALSLAKTKKVEDLVKWAEGRPVWISWKLDGLTLVVTYDNGKLTKIVTRGNGHVGTNITHLADGLYGVPRSVPVQGHLVIRGEAVISYSDFEEFCMESGDDFANPRNLASGSLSLKDVAEVKKRRIHWVPFTLVHSDEDILTWGGKMDLLEKAGLHPVEREFVEHPDYAGMGAAIGRWTDKVTGGENPYPVDGLVITFDDSAFAATGSVTGHHATRAGLAFKWQDESADTVLDHVEWSCAASSITPVAVFRPVELEGTTVKRASLCNISECGRLGIGGPGTEISVIKANKIIPKVIRVGKAVGEFSVPDRCPVCGAPTEVWESDTGVLKLHCTDADCAAKQLRKFTRFVSKGGLDIDGISVQTISKFVNMGWIKGYADFFRLSEHAEEMSRMDGFGEKSVQNVMASLERSRSPDAQHLLFALNIPMCGTEVAKRLTEAYTVEELAEIAVSGKDSVLSDIDGIGPEKSASFAGWFRDGRNMEGFRDLMAQIRVRDTERKEIGNRCTGLVFVVTGDVHHYANRDALKAYIESQGGKVTGSVTGSTDFLINNDIESTSSKNKKAKELGKPIISEDEFIARFG